MDIEVVERIEAVRDSVKSELAIFLTQQRSYLSAISPELIPVSDALDDYLLQGGKRLRPLFSYAGFLAAGSEPVRADIAAMASLELLQACALIHDDLMDGSDTRRGAPSIHKRFESMHHNSGLKGSSSQFGSSSAILLGDLALVWSESALHSSGIHAERLLDASRVFDEMRIELMAGQYLDVREAGESHYNVERSLRIARYKSGKYSIERPLHFGAALARASSSELQSALSAYGIPLGEAFQLRDDILGIFGDSETTGKPAGDDLREGKRTVLMAMTMERASSSAQSELTKQLGNPDLTQSDVDRLRALITETGAIEAVDRLIEDLVAQARTALTSPEIHQSAQPLLNVLIESAVNRSH